MKIALFDDYSLQQGSTKRGLELLCNQYLNTYAFPFVSRIKRSFELRNRFVHTSVLQLLWEAVEKFIILANLYFPACETLNLRDYSFTEQKTGLSQV